MSRATGSQRAERLNLARRWLHQGLAPSAATQKLVDACGVSQRQAYRYVEQAQRLKRPVPVEDIKVAFTVKLPRVLVEKVHRYAEVTGQTLSGIVSRALWALLRRGGGRG
jgi:predicted DNA-binding transcriptional regulator YafY